VAALKTATKPHGFKNKDLQRSSSSRTPQPELTEDALLQKQQGLKVTANILRPGNRVTDHQVDFTPPRFTVFQFHCACHRRARGFPLRDFPTSDFP